MKALNILKFLQTFRKHFNESTTDHHTGCPNNCNQNGECLQGEGGLWKCSCLPGWEGEDCSQATEQDCTDKKDNDGGEKLPLLC